jgi:hypothetical protein
MRAIPAFALLLAPLLLAACQRGGHKPDLPEGPAVLPQVVTVERVRYVAIPAHLTQELPVAEGPLSQCPDVAARRRADQEKLNSRLRQIRAIQGTEVKP